MTPYAFFFFNVIRLSVICGKSSLLVFPNVSLLHFVFVNQSTALQISVILWHFYTMISEVIVSYDCHLLMIWLDLH